MANDQASLAVASTVIEVANVEPARERLPEAAYPVAVVNLLTSPPSRWPEKARHQRAIERPRPIEGCSRYHGQLVANVYFHPVVAAIAWAFNDHRPLVLSPDIIWLLVAQGFANHINANAKELRRRVVEHSGRLTIAVRRDDFRKGSPENPWPEVFEEFTKQIRTHIGDSTHDLLMPAFSTTGATERAAAQVVLLDAMQSYFSYEVHTYCGIPQIILEGTADDWEKLAVRIQSLANFGLSWWTSVLAPLLDEFIHAVRGRVNARFWQSIYKLDMASGGPYTSGWITAFVPYLKDRNTGWATSQNTWLTQGDKELDDLLYPLNNCDPNRFRTGPTTEEFPGGLARAPFLWKHLRKNFDMEFLGGFVGVRQEVDSLRLRPEIGWVVREQ